jgi:predicted ATPase
MAKITHLHIQGYKSLHDAHIDLTNLNVLIGANGSGKSNLISFFRFLKAAVSGNLQEHVGREYINFILHFGTDFTTQLSVHIRIEHEEQIAEYRFQMERALPNTLYFADESIELIQSPTTLPIELTQKLSEKGHRESRIDQWCGSNHRAALILREILRRTEIYHISDTSMKSVVRNGSRVYDKSWLESDGSNLASFIFSISQNQPMIYNRFVSSVKHVIPNFDRFVLWPEENNSDIIYLKWRVKNHNYTFYPHQFSDGSIRSIFILALLLQSKEWLPQVIILDEPELGLHPMAVSDIAGCIGAAAHTAQMIVATQSPGMIDSFEAQDILTVNNRKGQSVFERLDMDRLSHWLEEYTLGPLWRANVIEAGPLR